MRNLRHGAELCFLYHLIRPLYLVNISMTGAHSGIQWNIYVKPLDIPPPLASAPPAPFTGLTWAFGDRSKTLSFISQNHQIDGSPIFHTRYLHWVATECCQIFNIGEGHNCLGRKSLKSAIYEVLSLLFSRYS